MAETAEDLAKKTDFAAQQFAKDQVADKVVAQYDDGPTRVFYQVTMGERHELLLQPLHMLCEQTGMSLSLSRRTHALFPRPVKVGAGMTSITASSAHPRMA